MDNSKRGGGEDARQVGGRQHNKRVKRTMYSAAAMVVVTAAVAVGCSWLSGAGSGPEEEDKEG